MQSQFYCSKRPKKKSRDEERGKIQRPDSETNLFLAFCLWLIISLWTQKALREAEKILLREVKQE